MQHSPPTTLARKLGAFVALSDVELADLAALQGRRRMLDPGSDVVHEGQQGHAAYVLVSGWVCSYKLMPDGTRQVIHIQIPGDFLGLRSLLSGASDHSFEPITRVEVAEIPRDDLLATFATSPRLATAVLWTVFRDEAMVVEHLVDVGRRSAAERLAHFLLELGARLQLVGLARVDGYACPLSQYLLADALGLTAIHVNRVLRQLREQGLLTFQKGQVRFDNPDALMEFAGFDTNYLDQAGPRLGGAHGTMPRGLQSDIMTLRGPRRSLGARAAR